MAIHANSTTAPALQRGLLRLVPDLASVEALLPPEPDTAARARALHARRELHQALDWGFALLDALDLSPRGLDIIDGAIAHLDTLDGDTDLEGGGDEEPSLGAPENHPARWHFDMEDRYHAGRARHPLGDQTQWAVGGVEDVEGEHDGREHEPGYDVACDDDELDGDPSDKEPSIGWPNDYRAVLSPVLMVDHDPEEVNEDGDDCGESDAPWWDRIGYPVMEIVHG